MNISRLFWDYQSRSYEKEARKYPGLHCRILQNTRKYLKGGDTVLDYGCATGKVACELADHVQEVHGLDFSARMIAAARKKAAELKIENVDFRQATIFDPVYPAESFDVVVALGILHLLKDPQKAIERIHALLKPGGLFVSSTACMADGHSVLDQINRFLSLLSRTGLFPHLRFCKIPELEGSIAQASFQILETESLLFDSESDQQQYIVARFVAAKKTEERNHEIR
jgi:2-polyprenyl-3-methyl-5-hydroxy-6-metoxy-1,4-benzoquinol methylase